MKFNYHTLLNMTNHQVKQTLLDGIVNMYFPWPILISYTPKFFTHVKKKLQ